MSASAARNRLARSAGTFTEDGSDVNLLAPNTAGNLLLRNRRCRAFRASQLRIHPDGPAGNVGGGRWSLSTIQSRPFIQITTFTASITPARHRAIQPSDR